MAKERAKAEEQLVKIEADVRHRIADEKALLDARPVFNGRILISH